MASPALSLTQPNGNGTGRVGTGSRSPSNFLYPAQRVPSAPKQTPVPVPDPRNPASGGNTTFTHAVASDLPQAANITSSANDEEQKARRFAEDYARLSAAMAECDPDAVRRAIRDNHERCLLGSHYHTAFLMNVTMHRADDGILQRAIRDFGSRIVSAGKHDLIGWMSQADIDEVADKIIAKASNTFLDKALVARLPTIEARRLVNALARAERLGYDAADIVENENVIPSLPSSTPLTTVQQYDPAQPLTSTPTQTTQLPSQTWNSANVSDLTCPTCGHVSPGPSAHKHHLTNWLCTRPLPPEGPGGETYVCPFCAQRLSILGALQYHMLNKICGDFGDIKREQILPTKPPAGLNPHTKRRAPDNAATYVSSGSNSPAPQYPPAPPAATQTPRTARPSAQPGMSPNVPLGTPQAKDMSHLTAHQIEALKGELRLAEESFKMKINDTQKSGGDPDEVQKKLTSLRNSYACKQSTIRKKYGIKLRQRRGLATEDPTLSTSQAPKTSQGESSRPSSSYQHGSYRVEVHLPSPSKQTKSASPNGTPGDTTASRVTSGGTMTAERLLQKIRGASGASGASADDNEEDSSSDDSSTEGED
ncbi:uncharacterized protein ColSpa_08357 [Colletotrichum spaethianum]|uniref:Uncharacterized protein n=1 Tax=Colletotrichum spaethianum TaxID=700344 RepID=A0AA37P9L2_9PEZI|nr:uncharacterized protein ColSpa_08357 [Colletotrichum spaethianum]GKT48176.1 hypothetical protein ColSpa_08357 [Colletotrichum spaethianum]